MAKDADAPESGCQDENQEEYQDRGAVRRGPPILSLFRLLGAETEDADAVELRTKIKKSIRVPLYVVVRSTNSASTNGCLRPLSVFDHRYVVTTVSSTALAHRLRALVAR